MLHLSTDMYNDEQALKIIGQNFSRNKSKNGLFW